MGPMMAALALNLLNPTKERRERNEKRSMRALPTALVLAVTIVAAAQVESEWAYCSARDGERNKMYYSAAIPYTGRRVELENRFFSYLDARYDDIGRPDTRCWLVPWGEIPLF